MIKYIGTSQCEFVDSFGNVNDHDPLSKRIQDMMDIYPMADYLGRTPNSKLSASFEDPINASIYTDKVKYELACSLAGQQIGFYEELIDNHDVTQNTTCTFNAEYTGLIGDLARIKVTDMHTDAADVHRFRFRYANEYKWETPSTVLSTDGTFHLECSSNVHQPPIYLRMDAVNEKMEIIATKIIRMQAMPTEIANDDALKNAYHYAFNGDIQMQHQPESNEPVEESSSESSKTVSDMLMAYPVIDFLGRTPESKQQASFSDPINASIYSIEKKAELELVLRNKRNAFYNELLSINELLNVNSTFKVEYIPGNKSRIDIKEMSADVDVYKVQIAYANEYEWEMAEIMSSSDHLCSIPYSTGNNQPPIYIRMNVYDINAELIAVNIVRMQDMPPSYNTASDVVCEDIARSIG